MTVLGGRIGPTTTLVMVEGRTAVVRVHGDLDVASAPHLRETLRDLVAHGKSQIVVDASGVEFVDSAGLEVLLGGCHRAESANGRLALVCGPSSRVRRLLQVSGVDDVLRPHGTVDEARAAVAGLSPPAS